MSKREPDTEPTQQPSTTTTEAAKTGISRRGFLKGAEITAAGTALIDGIQVSNQNAVAATTKDVRELGPEAIPHPSNFS